MNFKKINLIYTTIILPRRSLLRYHSLPATSFFVLIITWHLSVSLEAVISGCHFRSESQGIDLSPRKVARFPFVVQRVPELAF